MPVMYFKDSFMEESECHISVRDRSFRFGDGIFETMLVVNGRICDMEAHLERLKNGLAAFRLDALDAHNLPEICAGIIERNALVSGYVRIIVSRGVDEQGGGGYLPKGSVPYCIVQATDRPYPQFKPVSLWQSSYNVGLHTPAKTNNALIYILALLEASDNSCDNALMLDRQGYICETASGNIFWLKGDTLYTPATSLPFVPGTMRSKLLGLWEDKCEQGHFSINDLENADEIFMTNTGTIIAPVTSIEPLGKKIAVGEHTKYLRKRLDEEIQRK